MFTFFSAKKDFLKKKLAKLLHLCKIFLYFCNNLKTTSNMKLLKSLKKRFILQDTRWFTFDTKTLSYKRVKQKTLLIVIAIIVTTFVVSNFVAYNEGVFSVIEKYQDSLRVCRNNMGYINFIETYEYIGEENTKWDTLIHKASRTYGVPFGVIKAVISVESSFNDTAESPVGAKGLMQIMPLNYKSLNITDPFNVTENVMGGTKMLCSLYNKYNDWEKVLAFYNGGYNGIDNPSLETIEYVKKVTSRIKKITIIEEE